MSKIDINSQVEIKCSTWDEFKKYIDGSFKELPVQYVEVSEGYRVFCIDNSIVVSFLIYYRDTDKPGIDKDKNNEDLTDFENNWKLRSNMETSSKVTICDWKGFRKTRMIERRFELDAVQGQAVSRGTFSLPYPIVIVCGKCLGEWSPSPKDRFSFYEYPPNDGLVGVLAQEALGSQSSVTFPLDVAKIFVPGDFVKFGNDNEIYEIIGVNTETGVITLGSNLSRPLVLGELVKARFPYAINLIAIPNQVQLYGDLSPGRFVIDSNWVLEAIYNHDPVPSQNFKIGFTLVYYHGTM